MHDWAAMTSAAVSAAPVGFDRVAALVAAGMEFFATHHDFVVIWRREAIEGGGRLEDAMAEHMRPFLERADRVPAARGRGGAAARARLGRADAARLRGGLDLLLGRRVPRAGDRRGPDDARGAGALRGGAHRDAAGRAGSTLSRPLRKGRSSIMAWV